MERSSACFFCRLACFLIVGGSLCGPGRCLDEARYRNEYKRTHPDFVVYLPKGERTQGENQHFIVVQAPNKKRLVAFWTQATRENHPDQRVVYAKSDDGGVTWTAPEVLDGASPGDPRGTGLASWAFPIVTPETGRIWVFYNKNIGIQDTREDTTGVLRGRYSEDDGETWSETFDLQIAPCALSHPDPSVPQSWIVYQAPIRTPDGVPIAGFTHWGSASKYGKVGLLELDSEIRFMRFENIVTATDPATLKLTTWPKTSHGLRVRRNDKPEVSVAQEPSIVVLPDQRLFCVMRTLNGYIAWTVSEDNGHTWSDPKPLHYYEGGPVVKQPIAPCPIYEWEKGTYILLFHNNDGTANGGKGPTDFRKNRRPAFVSVGHYSANQTQPVWFEKPVLLMDNDGVVLGPSRRTEVATYTSFGLFGDRRVLWYPDRKHFLLGKVLRLADISGGRWDD